MGFEKYKQKLENLKEDRAANFDKRTDAENYLVDMWIRMTAEVCRDFRALENDKTSASGLNKHFVSNHVCPYCKSNKTTVLEIFCDDCNSYTKTV